MQKSILLYLSKLEGFKTAIKNCHWAAKSMNAHEFMDSLEDIVSDHQDLVAEVVQGAYNTKIKVNDFKPRPYRISTFTKLVADIYNAADKFYATIQGNKRFIGLRSVMEDFMAKMHQQIYLNAMCTESVERIKKSLNEGFNWESSGDSEKDYLNNLLNMTNHLFRNEEDRNQTWFAYSNKCKRQGERPNLDGFLDYINVSHQDLMSADDFYNDKDNNYLQTVNKMSKKIVRLTENELRRVISESVYKIINEMEDMDFLMSRKKKQIELKDIIKYINQKVSEERYRAEAFESTYFEHYSTIFNGFESITTILLMNNPRFEKNKIQILKNILEAFKHFLKICRQDTMERDLLIKVCQDLNEFSSNPSDVKKWEEIAKEYLRLDLTSLPRNMGRSYDRF